MVVIIATCKIYNPNEATGFAELNYLPGGGSPGEKEKVGPGGARARNRNLTHPKRVSPHMTKGPLLPDSAVPALSIAVFCAGREIDWGGKSYGTGRLWYFVVFMAVRVITWT